MYIKDLTNGKVRKYGANHHDSLVISEDGKTLSYENLQNEDGSKYGDYRFCDEDGVIPCDDEVLMRYGADAYFNIGGFEQIPRKQDLAYIADKYGYKQIDIAIEEMSELIKELCKLKRAKTPLESAKVLIHIAEEMADVQIMILQLMMLLDIQDAMKKYYNDKIDRQLIRMKEEDTALEN